MRDISINAVETVTWQFYVDATMTVSLIMPPSGGGDFRAFPCGPDAIGRLLFEVLGLDDNLINAVDFYNQFRAQEKIQNAVFRRRGSDGIVRTIMISGSPLFNKGHCEGYRCTASDITPGVCTLNDGYEAARGRTPPYAGRNAETLGCRKAS